MQSICIPLLPLQAKSHKRGTQIAGSEPLSRCSLYNELSLLAKFADRPNFPTLSGLLTSEKLLRMKKNSSILMESNILQSKIGVYPRCSPCKRQRSGHRYCGTETAIKACLNWPPNQSTEPGPVKETLPQDAVAKDTDRGSLPVNRQGTKSKGVGRVNGANKQVKKGSESSGLQQERGGSETESPSSPENEATRLLLDGDWTESQLTALQVGLQRNLSFQVYQSTVLQSC